MNTCVSLLGSEARCEINSHLADDYCDSKGEKMNSAKIITAIILSILLLCSCVAAPENLRNPDAGPPYMGTQADNPMVTDISDDNNTTLVETDLVERGSLEVIRNQLALDLQKTYKNLTIKNVRVSNALFMPTYDIDIGINPDYDFTLLLEHLYGDSFNVSDEKNYFRKRVGDIVSQGYPAYTEPTYNEEEGTYMNVNVYFMDIDGFTPSEDYTLSSYMYSLGNVWGSQTGLGSAEDNRTWYNFSTKKKHKRYDLYVDYPANDEVYTMADGQKWGVAEAIKYVENFWNTYIAPSDPEDYTYSAKTLWVLELGNEKYGYLFSMQRQDKDGNYFDVDKCEYYNHDNEYVINNEPFIFTNRLTTYCAEKESITSYAKDFSFSLTNQVDSGDELLTLGAACETLSNALAKNISVNLTAELNYVVYCKGYPYYQIWEKPIFHEYKCLADCDFELRPVWCFRTPNQCYLQSSFDPERFFVDAVTGEVSTIVNYEYKKVENAE